MQCDKNEALEDMLELQMQYTPKAGFLEAVQTGEIGVHERRLVADWLLDVCSEYRSVYEVH